LIVYQNYPPINVIKEQNTFILKSHSKTFKKENKYSIFKPKKDKCDMCASYEIGLVSENKNSVHIVHKDCGQAEKESKKITCQSK